MPELLLDEFEVDVPELLLDEGPAEAGVGPVGEEEFACVAEADGAFEPHPKALKRHRVATNKTILDTGSPWDISRSQGTLIPNDYDCSRVSA